MPHPSVFIHIPLLGVTERMMSVAGNVEVGKSSPATIPFGGEVKAHQISVGQISFYSRSVVTAFQSYM